MADDTPAKPFHPAPSVGHELGIMFGFMAVFVISMATYLVVWRASNRRSEKHEQDRREALVQQGFGPEKTGDNALAREP